MNLRTSLRNANSKHPYVYTHYLISIPLMMYQGDYKAAHEYLVIMEEYVKTQGEKCEPSILFSVYRFRGMLWKKCGEYSKAKDMFEATRQYHDGAFYQKPFVYYYTLLKNIVKLMLMEAQPNLELIHHYMDEMSSQMQQQYGSTHPDYAMLSMLKGQIAMHEGHVSTAIDLFQAALEIQKKFFGYVETHPIFIKTHLAIAHAYIKLHNFSDAKSNLDIANRAAELFKRKSYKKNHILFMEYLLIKGEICLEIGKRDEQYLEETAHALTQWTEYAIKQGISTQHIVIKNLVRLLDKIHLLNPVIFQGIKVDKMVINAIIKFQAVARGMIARRVIQANFKKMLDEKTGFTDRNAIKTLLKLEKGKKTVRGAFLMEKLNHPEKVNDKYAKLSPAVSGIFPLSPLNTDESQVSAMISTEIKPALLYVFPEEAYYLTYSRIFSFNLNELLKQFELTDASRYEKNRILKQKGPYAHLLNCNNANPRLMIHTFYEGMICPKPEDAYLNAPLNVLMLFSKEKHFILARSIGLLSDQSLNFQNKAYSPFVILFLTLLSEFTHIGNSHMRAYYAAFLLKEKLSESFLITVHYASRPELLKKLNNIENIIEKQGDYWLSSMDSQAWVQIEKNGVFYIYDPCTNLTHVDEYNDLIKIKSVTDSPGVEITQELFSNFSRLREKLNQSKEGVPCIQVLANPQCKIDEFQKKLTNFQSILINQINLFLQNIIKAKLPEQAGISPFFTQGATAAEETEKEWLSLSTSVSTL